MAVSGGLAAALPTVAVAAGEWHSAEVRVNADACGAHTQLDARASSAVRWFQAGPPPGVPAFAAVAAALKTEFTLPEIAQTVILTRTAMQSSAMPPGETLEELGRSGATLAIHLSIRNLAYIERALTPHYGADCPVVVAYRITWPDEMIIRGTLSTIARKVREAKITRTALVLVGPVLDAHGFRDSALYDAAHEHVLRNRKTAKA